MGGYLSGRARALGGDKFLPTSGREKGESQKKGEQTAKDSFKMGCARAYIGLRCLGNYLS